MNFEQEAEELYNLCDAARQSASKIFSELCASMPPEPPNTVAKEQWRRKFKTTLQQRHAASEALVRYSAYRDRLKDALDEIRTVKRLLEEVIGASLNGEAKHDT